MARRLATLAGHLQAQQGPAPPPIPTPAAADSPPLRPSGRSPVRPTLDAAQALADFKNEGFCVLKDVLDAEQVAKYRDHLLGVMGDVRFLGPDGSRRDPATRRFTEPVIVPPRDRGKEQLSRYSHTNHDRGQRFHNGDFGQVYGDELRLGVEGYIRHDPRWGSLGCETRRVLDVVEPLMGSDFRVVYTDGFVEYPGAKALAWHSGAPHCHAVRSCSAEPAPQMGRTLSSAARRSTPRRGSPASGC